MGARLLYVSGMLAGSLFGGVLFATLEYVDSASLFLALSYVFRFLFGTSDAAAFGASLGIVVKLFPDKFVTAVSLIETFFGFGYAIGKKISRSLHDI